MTAARVPRRLPEAPLTPRDCLRTRNVSGPCQGCGSMAKLDQPMHLPIRGATGIFCGQCCPCCNSGRQEL